MNTLLVLAPYRQYFIVFAFCDMNCSKISIRPHRLIILVILLSKDTDLSETFKFDSRQVSRLPMSSSEYFWDLTLTWPVVTHFYCEGKHSAHVLHNREIGTVLITVYYYFYSLALVGLVPRLGLAQNLANICHTRHKFTLKFLRAVRS